MRTVKATTSPITEALDQVQQVGILIPCRAEIHDYLKHHRCITSLLARLAQAALDELPQDAQLSLELYRDAESGEIYPTLYVRQQHYSREIVHRTDAVMEPFYKELETCPGWMLLTTDFRQPR